MVEIRNKLKKKDKTTDWKYLINFYEKSQYCELLSWYLRVTSPTVKAVQLWGAAGGHCSTWSCAYLQLQVSSLLTIFDNFWHHQPKILAAEHRYFNEFIHWKRCKLISFTGTLKKFSLPRARRRPQSLRASGTPKLEVQLEVKISWSPTHRVSFIWKCLLFGPTWSKSRAPR